MTFDNISLQRLNSQKLIVQQPTSIKSVVGHFGAMQAQDYAMAKWGIGVRNREILDKDIDAALASGEIVRTHVLRPTWHFTAGEDVQWMLDITAKNVRRLMGTNDRKLGLDETIFKNSFKLIERALRDGEQLTRSELMEILQREKIDVSEYRSGHIMMAAELEGLVASGAKKGKEHTYALLSGRVKPRKLNREEALYELAKVYFTSHGPATLKDYMWWSGLSNPDAKIGIALNEKKLRRKEINDKEYFYIDEEKQGIHNSVFLLPAFDEFLIGYTDRSASIESKFNKHAFTTNGIFRPIVVVNGKVCGTWKRTIKKEWVLLEVQFFARVDDALHSKITILAEQYGHFLGKEATVIFNQL